ncbi:MAG: hypothetical protein Q8M24_26350 [Pseudolabrys sp.]|nr:hypothetical protein [Pseudolabrys sp.]MDP2298977.1 hypothetical protein [Pseudolabrys sp.]
MTTRRIALIAFTLLALAAPAAAGNYPIDGKWGLSASTEKKPIDCSKLRVIAFNGSQRTDSQGGVPAYRNRTVEASGGGQYRVVDEFTTGQIGNAKANYTLRVVDADTVEMKLEKGGTLRLRKCK